MKERGWWKNTIIAIRNLTLTKSPRVFDVKKQIRQALVEKSEQLSATTQQLNSLKLPKAGARHLAPWDQTNRADSEEKKDTREIGAL